MSRSGSLLSGPLPALVLLLGLAAGAALSASGRPTAEPEPVALLAAGAAGSLLLGWTLPRRLVPAYGALAGAAVAALVLTSSDGMSGAPQAGPLGYGNANGALCAQATAAAMIPLLVLRRRSLRALSLLLATSLVLLAWRTASAAGFTSSLVCFLVPLALAVTRERTRGRVARIVLLAGASGVTAAVLLTIGVAVTYEPGRESPGGVQGLVERGLSERRVALWAEALDLTVTRPLAGVGAGRFAVESGTARQDEDARWAHSAFLQHAAETGLPGLLMMIGLTTSLFVALWRTAGTDALAGLGASAVTALGAHATIDYVLHFPTVPLLALATVGVCMGKGSGLSERR